MNIYIKEPCRINGKHYDIGDNVELEASDAMSVIAAGRGSLVEVQKPDSKKSKEQ